jgi:DNA primase
MFPIIQPGGRVLGFSGRILPRFAEADEGHDGQKAPKYVNSPESVLYKKARTLFGLHVAGNAMRERERAILVEGQVDVVTMHGRGYSETVASLGTALTKPQCELLARFTDRVVLCYDGDRAGVKASHAALPLLLEQGMDVRIAPLEQGEDPDSADPERLANLLSRPGSALEWLMKRMVDKGARQSIDAKARALRALVPLLRCVHGRDARGDYAHLAATMLEIPARRVWTAVESAARGREGESVSREGEAGHVKSGTQSRPADGGHRPLGSGGPTRDSARVSQFPGGMPHSATMRSQPLPPAQADVTRLLVERPELSRVAQREGAIEYVTDPRLRPILERVIWAATEGEPIPSEGELLDLIDPAAHQLVHACLAPNHEKLSYANAEDPGAALRDALAHCRRDELQAERAKLERSIAEAARTGDHETAKSLSKRRIELKVELEKLSLAARR